MAELLYCIVLNFTGVPKKVATECNTVLDCVNMVLKPRVLKASCFSGSWGNNNLHGGHKEICLSF